MAERSTLPTCSISALLRRWPDHSPAYAPHTQVEWEEQSQRAFNLRSHQPGTPDSIGIATVHFPQEMHADTRAKHCKAVAKFRTNARATFSLIQEGMNENIEHSYKGWLKRTLSKTWKEYHCPHTTGRPRNQVLTKKRISMTKMDWLFLHNNTPFVACTRDQLPGVITHKVEQYTLTIDCDHMKPTTPPTRDTTFATSTKMTSR